ncbi:hypothetical protein LR48_Vigan11g106100 [Vigna angularis]|uniref:Uncharacterized protein n=1 Tax=Phaseolus angularis TaxID=3914 RepID=A0A0L9VSW3_PHAAN|nr:hypothetical protein LR48_Vigan11g106100 [Vigna angularis]
MVEAPHSSGDEVPTSKPTKGAMRLRQLILWRNAARDYISILTPSFDHVSKADRNLIWQDLLMTFDIPNVASLRNRKLGEKIMKQKSDSKLPFSEDGEPPPPPSPPSRHEM